MKVIISGGGTGGHIYPAVAIANEIRKQKPDTEILFVGALGKMEMEKVPKEGYNIIGLPIAGFNRSNLLANLSFPYKLIKSMWKAYKVVSSFKPDIAIGVGGFASGPTLKMANLLGVKTLLQEQNSYAGVTNKILAKKAEKVCVAYPNMEHFFEKEKIVFTGNPLRNDMLLSGISKEDAKKHFGLKSNKFTLLIIGGSLGALSINKAILEGLNKLIQNDIQIIWQTGKTFITEAKNHIQNLEDVYISDFIYEMDKAYAAADLVISRAGALSVSELALVGKASILVPLPIAAEDHQTKNAESLSKNGAALLMPDHQAQKDLVNMALNVIKNQKEIDLLEKAIKAFAKPDAAKEIVTQTFRIIKP